MGKWINYGVEHVNTHVHHTDTKGYSTELQLRALVWMKLKKRSNETMEVIELLQAPTSHKLFRATYLENREIYKNSMT